LKLYRTILVTGATGFIGSNICRQLKNSNQDYRVLSPSKGEVDLLNRESFECFISDFKPDIVIHCAAQIPNNSCFSESRIINNLIDSHVSESLKCHLPEARLIYCSGTSFYKPSLDLITEQSIVEAKNQYFQSKFDGEQIIKKSGINATILRISAPYGQGQKAQTVIHKFIDQALKNEPLYIFGSGERVQNFTYIDDVVSAFESALSFEINGVFNICSDETVSMKYLAETIIEITDSKSKIKSIEQEDPDTLRTLLISNQKAKSLLGWVPTNNIRNGLLKMLNERSNNI